MDKQLIEKIVNNSRIPSLPAAAMEIIELCRRDDVRADEMARAVSKDPALAIKVLRTVNSGYYGLGNRVTTISHALVLLGLGSVKTLALGFSLLGTIKGMDGEDFDPSVIWQRCLHSAVGARIIAQKLGIAEPEEAFLGGLLQDLGILAMVQALGSPYVRLVKAAGDCCADLCALEQKHLGLDHTEVGEALAGEWNLPPVLAAPIRYHVQPNKAPSEGKNTVYAVALGDKAAIPFLRERAPEATHDYLRSVAEWFNMDQAVALEILEAIGEAAPRMGKLFEITGAVTRDVGAILAEANELISELSLKSQRRASEMEQKAEQLQVRATRDGLTGANNRGEFDRFFGQQFERAAQGEGLPLSLIMLDVDRFKNVNDAHGHPAGDKVLITLAQVLMAESPENTMLARYGGEEFVVVAPGMDRSKASGLAERMRLRIEETPVEAGKDLVLNITVSFGVATYDDTQTFKTPAELIKAADQALYAAKAGGRNAVSVYAPDTRQIQDSEDPTGSSAEGGSTAGQPADSEQGRDSGQHHAA